MPLRGEVSREVETAEQSVGVALGRLGRRAGQSRRRRLNFRIPPAAAHTPRRPTQAVDIFPNVGRRHFARVE